MRQIHIERPKDRDFLLYVRRSEFDLELTQLITGSKREVTELLRECGVIVFKGYGIDQPGKLRQAALAYSENLLSYNERAAPRKELRDKVYTSTEFPKEETIPLHHEMAYSYNYPRYLYFCCCVPAQSGGITPVADTRVVMRKIPKHIRDKFIQKKIMYVRNFGTSVDMEWRTAFQTDSRAEVEKYLTDHYTRFTWQSERCLQTQFITDPVVSHPETGELVWFNHAHLFHSSNLPGEVRAALVDEFSERGLPRNVFYGDGEPIEDEHLELIRNIYVESALGESWERGDFMLIDNLRAVHGRTPYTGAREVCVCMSDLLSRDVGYI